MIKVSIGIIGIFLAVVLYVLSIQNVVAKEIVDCDKVRDNDFICMACNIYYEARSEPLLGQSIVGLVVLSRVSSSQYPDTICKVIWQPHQFSWTKDGIPDKVQNSKAWSVAIRISRNLIGSNTLNGPYISNIMWYHNKTVSPWWAASKSHIATIGDHLFYSN